jgi:hypothetical protein
LQIHSPKRINFATFHGGIAMWSFLFKRRLHMIPLRLGVSLLAFLLLSPVPLGWPFHLQPIAVPSLPLGFPHLIPIPPLDGSPALRILTGRISNFGFSIQ